MALALAASLRSFVVTEANAGTPTMQLRASGTGVTCDDAANPTKCAVPLSGPFTLLVAVTTFPGDPDGAGPLGPGYISMATDIDWSTSTGGSLLYNSQAAGTEITWPDKSGLNSRNIVSPTRVQHGDLSTGYGNTPSTFEG